MAEWSIAALRTILSTETDADSDLNEELMSQIRENIEAILMLTFFTGDSGTLTSDPPNDTTGVLTDTGQAFTVDEHNGRVVVITSGTAEGNIYQIDDTTSTTIVATGDNLYSDSIRSGDTFKIFYNLKATAGHTHDDIDSPNVTLAANSIALSKLVNSTAGNYRVTETYETSTVATSEVTFITFKVGRAGTYRVRYGLKNSSASYITYLRIYATSTLELETSTQSTTYVETYYDLTLTAGEIVTIKGNTNNASGTATVYAAMATGNPVEAGGYVE